MAKGATLIDVAQAVGVAPSTVQRALSGAPGVGEAKRQEIKEVARKMGYQRNAMATMLKSQARELALVLPEPDYYTRHLWDGAEQCLSENAGFGFTCHRATYPRSPEALAETLEQVYAKHGRRLSGVVTMGEPVPRAQAIYQKWRADRVPVVFIGTDSDPADRMCCSCGDDAAAGRLAADLTLLLGRPEAAPRLLLTGDFTVADQYYNMQAFEQVLLQDAPGCEIVKLSCPTAAGPEAARRILAERMGREPDMLAFYSTSARNTVAMCQAAQDAGLPVGARLIGSDLFAESRAFLQDGLLSAVIHKRPTRQAYDAVQTLVNYIVHGLTPPSQIFCRPFIVTRNSIGTLD